MNAPNAMPQFLYASIVIGIVANNCVTLDDDNDGKRLTSTLNPSSVELPTSGFFHDAYISPGSPILTTISVGAAGGNAMFVTRQLAYNMNTIVVVLKKLKRNMLGVRRLFFLFFICSFLTFEKMNCFTLDTSRPHHPIFLRDTILYPFFTLTDTL